MLTCKLCVTETYLRYFLTQLTQVYFEATHNVLVRIFVTLQQNADTVLLLTIPVLLC